MTKKIMMTRLLEALLPILKRCTWGACACSINFNLRSLPYNLYFVPCAEMNVMIYHRQAAPTDGKGSRQWGITAYQQAFDGA